MDDTTKPTKGISPLPPPAETHCHTIYKKDWWEKVKPFVEIAGALLLLVYTAYTIKMYLANKRAANAAESAANVAKDSLNIVQRAYISIGEIGGSRIGVSNDPKTISLLIMFSWENAGYTPTRNMTTHISYKFYKIGLPADWKFPNLWESIPPPHTYSPVVVSPKGRINYTVGPIPSEDIQKIQLHRDRLFFWGWAKYHDVFNNTPEHITEFCYELVAFNGNPLSPDVKEPFAPLWNSCTIHNCQDQECKP